MSPNPTTPTDRSDRPPLPSLTGSRFLAALIVFAAHAVLLVWMASFDVAGHETVIRVSVSTVQFFFVLSGFVMVWSARPGDTVTKFWRRRALRIFPAHVVVWAFFTALVVAGGAFSALSIFPTLFLVQNFLPIPEMNQGVNPVAWSLSVEMFCYMLFPLILPLVRRIPFKALWPAAIGLMAAVPLVAFAAGFIPGEPMAPGASMTQLQQWLVYLCPPVRALEFVLGMVLARIFMEGGRVPLGLGSSSLLLLAAYPLGLNVPMLYAYAAVAVVPLALWVLALAKADMEGTFSPFRNRIAVWGGDTSYSLYLVHFLVLMAVVGAFGMETERGLLEGTAILLGTFVVSLALARLLYRTVEVPAMRRWAESRKAPEAPEAPEAGGVLETGEADRAREAAGTGEFGAAESRGSGEGADGAGGVEGAGEVERA